jgi:hypothetical protein
MIKMMNSIFRRIIILSIGLLPLLILSCTGPNPDETLKPEDKDVYVTNHDPGADFSSYKTFFVDDSIVVIYNERTYQVQRTTEDIALLDAIREEMSNIGFVEVDSAKKADVGISVSKIAVNYTGIDYTYNYGSPYGYYDPFYYGGYGYSYPSYYVYQVKRGSVMVDMVDIKNSSSNSKYNVVWNGQFIDGLGTLSSSDRIIKGVRSLFTQSAILKEGK